MKQKNDDGTRGDFSTLLAELRDHTAASPNGAAVTSDLYSD